MLSVVSFLLFQPADKDLEDMLNVSTVFVHNNESQWGPKQNNPTVSTKAKTFLKYVKIMQV